MTDPDFTGLPDHPSLEVTRAMGRALFTGIPELKARDLLVKWSQTGMYEGGIDYERPEPPSGADGLVVVEFKEPSSP
jgi:hypothetical protein